MTDDPVRMTTDPAPEAEVAATAQPPQPENTNDAPLLAMKREADPAEPSWLVHRIKSISLRYKIAGTLIVILSLAVASLGIVTFARQNAILHSEIKSRAATLAHQLANAGKEGLLTKQEMAVYSTITDILDRNDVVYALVLDAEGKVFAHSDLSKQGSVPAVVSEGAALKAGDLLFQEALFNNDAVLDVTMPIMLKTTNLKLGVARVGLSQKTLNESIRRQKEIYLWVALGFVVGGLLVSFALARMITKPLDSLAEGIKVVGRGDLRKLVAVRSDDEIGSLTSAFNTRN